LKKISIIVVCSLLITTLVLGLSPGLSGKSDNICSMCHDSYYQYLDLLEGDSNNQIPTTIDIGETKTVSILIQNEIEASGYIELYDVAVELNSQSGHFSVSSPVYHLDYLLDEIAIATWEITGVSEGVDSLEITAKGRNYAHEDYFLSLSDSYSPSPSITVGSSSGSTSEPSPEPTPEPTQEPTAEPTPPPTTEPTLEPTPEPTPEPTHEPTPEPTLEPNPTPQEPEPKSSEPNPTQPTETSPTITTEILIAVAVAIAFIFAAVGYWAIKRK
jgi:hypothetical protein